MGDAPSATDTELQRALAENYRLGEQMIDIVDAALFDENGQSVV